jgi:hypothetical protein
MDYAERASSAGLESASVEDKTIEAEKTVSANIMTRPVAERV